MRSVQRVATLALLMFSATVVARQDKQDAYDDQLRRGDILVSQRNYEEALKEYKKAYALTNKTSLEAALGMAVAYRGLGAHKNVVDLLSNEAMKLAGDDAKNKAKVYNLRGAALVALAEKPNDKRFADAEADFRAALAANPELYSAQLNLGITLLKQERDEDGRRELQLYVDRAPKGPDTADALRMIEEPRRARETFAPDFSFTSKDGEFISLEERTAIANRANADLFLSIHANASPNPAARGIETYFLNFAQNKDAEAIATRENSGSGRTLHSLTDIVRTITLNDKIDESRNLALSVQSAMYASLRRSNKQAKSLGVKQAPFQVLIGATMPSVLAEISFMTNEREGALLKSDKYREQIASALYDGLVDYRRSLKTSTANTRAAKGAD